MTGVILSDSFHLISSAPPDTGDALLDHGLLPKKEILLKSLRLRPISGGIPGQAWVYRATLRVRCSTLRALSEANL